MTTVAQARTALVAAVGAVDDYADPPACMVFSEGTDAAARTLKGTVLWNWRVMCYVGTPGDNATTDVELTAFVAAKVLILLALQGWEVGAVSGSTIRTTLAGGQHLAADIAVSSYVTLS